MYTIYDVERVLERHPWLRPPKHVFIVKEKIEFTAPGIRVLFRGLQPSWRPDVIIISAPYATDETVIHEILHTYGLGEYGAHKLAPVIVRLRSVVPTVFVREVRYRKCDYCDEFKEVHERLGDKVEHWVLVG